MSETPWTPGPWQVGAERGYPEVWHHPAPGDPDEIPVLVADGMSAADARLIAKAPEMAEFIRSVAEAYDGPVDHARDAARALLAEIKGETS